MKVPYLSMIIAGIVLSLNLVFGDLTPLLVWSSGGHFLQLLSGHFVHISGVHLAWNLVAFSLLASLLEQYSRSALVLSVLLGVIAVDSYLLTLYLGSSYAGLSAVLNTILVSLLYQLYKKPVFRTASIMTFVAALVKIVYEWSMQEAVFSSLRWPPVPQAHFVGFVAGVILNLSFHYWGDRVYTNGIKNYTRNTVVEKD